MKYLLLMGGVECNPGPKCKVKSHTDAENYNESTSGHQDTLEVQRLRKRVNELETQVLAVNVLHVTELANQKQEYEQRLRQQKAHGSWLGGWLDNAGRLQEIVPKDKLRLFLYCVLVVLVVFILMKTGRRHHGHGNRFLWGWKH